MCNASHSQYIFIYYQNKHSIRVTSKDEYKDRWKKKRSAVRHIKSSKKQYLKCYNKSKIIIKVKYTTEIKQKKLK